MAGTLVVSPLLALSLYLSSVSLPLADIEFAMAVEDTVMAVEGAQPPPAWRAMLGELGNECWRCRERASKQAWTAALTDYRWLFWGRRDQDPEVRARANQALRRRFGCEDCHGTGRSETEHWDEFTNETTWACSACRGTGTEWVWSLWY